MNLQSTRWFTILSLILVLLLSPGKADALEGVCHDAPGIPCNGGSPGRSSGYSIDPEYRAMIAEQRRLEAEERARKAEARRTYRTPYRGFEKLQESYKMEMRRGLNRLPAEAAVVKEVTTEVLPGSRAAIFVPDGSLGDVQLAHPVHPTASETDVAAEQLQKTAAVLSFMQNGGRSAEDQHFLAAQSALLMTGSRSYVHVEAGSVSSLDESPARQASLALTVIAQEQNAYVDATERQDRVLETAKREIKSLVALREELKAADSPAQRADLLQQQQQHEARMDALERAYFELEACKQHSGELIGQRARQLKEEIVWKK